ncbi:MAG: hypothetical protein IJK77_00905 [Lachnospiraceae bacterium]|nr:hypothetical protein [Lachnospiraceae bacterium]
MIYAFDAEVSAPKGKLSREDRGEIRDYMAEVRVEAADPDKAVKLLVKQLQGRLKGEVKGGEAVIGLPDYGSACTVKVKAHEET